MTACPSLPTSWPEVLFVADMARLLRTSRRSIYRGLAAGRFPFAPLPLRLDRKLRWSRDAVLADLAAGVVWGRSSRRVA